MWYVFLFHRLDLDVAWTDLHDAVNSGELASMVVRVVSRLTAHLDLRAFEGGVNDLIRGYIQILSNLTVAPQFAFGAQPG